MLANNTFAGIEEEDIKIAKFITKEQACLLPKISIKLNNIWIKPALNGDITLSQETCVEGVSLIKDHKASTTCSNRVVRTNLSPKSST